MKPVELEILMKDGLTPGLKNAGRIVRQYSSDMQADLKGTGQSLKLQQEYIGKLERELKHLEKSLKGVTAGSNKWVEIKQRMAEVAAEIETERPAITELKNRYEELKETAEGADVSLKTQLRNLTQEIATLMIAYAKLSNEEKATSEGSALKRHIDELTEKAGVLRDAMGDTIAAINNAASDTRGFDQLSGAFQVAIDGFGLATACTQVFGSSQEDLIEIQTKLQAAIVASNAVSSIQNNLQKQSALMQGIQIIQTKAAATAESIKTAAQGKGIIVTRAATVAQAAFNAVARANPYILLATACMTFVGALWAFSKGSKEAREAEEQRQKQMEAAKRREEEFRDAIASSAAATISKYLELKKAWEGLGDSLDRKKKFVDEHKEAFRQLGVEIRNVGDAQKYLTEQTNLAIEALARQAVADAFSSQLADALKPYAEEWDTHRQFDMPVVGTRVRYMASGSHNGKALDEYHLITEDEFQQISDKLRREYTAPSAAGGGSFTSYYLTDEAYEALKSLRNQVHADARKSATDKMLQISEQYAQEQQKQNDIIKGLYEQMGITQTPPNKQAPNNPKDSDKDDRLEYERRVAEELQKLKWQNEQAEIDRMEEGAEKRRRQIALDYEKQSAEIQNQKNKWKEAQNGSLTKEQEDELQNAQTLAAKKKDDALKEVEKDEVAKNRAKLNELLQQYKDFDQRRQDIDKAYKDDMDVLNEELARLEAEGLDTTEIKSAISAREAAYKSSITSLQSEVLQASDFYDKLFGTVSDRGYKVLKDFYKQAKETLDNAKVDGDGVEISIPVKDADGKFVKKAVKITVDEYRRMLKRVQDIKKQLEKDNPFAALRTSWSDLFKAIKEGGDVSGALKDLNAKGKEVSNTIRGWSDSLGSVFGDNFKNSMNEIMNFCDGMMDMGTGIAQIWSGDIIGGITNTLSGLGSIFSIFSSWKEKIEEMKREWYIAEIETTRVLRERSAEYAANRSEISDIIKDAELLNWLIEKGYAKPSSVSVWEAESSALNEYTNNLRKESAVYDELWEKLQGSEGHYEWGNSLVGGSATWSLRGFNAEIIELWYNQDKLSDAAKTYYEAWVESGKSIEDLIDKINKCKASMREMVLGISFDNFLSNAADALKKMRSDVSELGKFTEDTLAEAILNGFMYRDLANVLEPLYNELSDAFIDGTSDAAYLEEWRIRFEEIMNAAGDRLDAIADATGVDLNSANGTTQSGKAGGFTAMSQEQGTKLEGLFVSVQMHVTSIDEKMEDVSDRMGQAVDRLRKIEENTGRTADTVKEVRDDIRKIIRDGIRTK